MRKMYLLAAMLLSAFASQAQQAIFERHDTRSPQFNDDGTVTYTVVELGRRMGNRYEIISGLDDNATVVLTGQTKLKNGIKVDVVK